MKKRIISIFLILVMVISMVTVVLPVSASASMIEDQGKALAKSLIQKGISKIPYVGPIASGLLGPTLNKILDIKTTGIGDVLAELKVINEKLDEIKSELDDIQNNLDDLKVQLDESTQHILNQMFKNMTFGTFNDSLTAVTTITRQKYNEIQLLYAGELADGVATSELYKTLKVAELIETFNSTNTADYVNMVLTLSRYLDGSQVAFSNSRGLFENAFLAGCNGSVLGGEAAMRVAPYLNQVSGALADAYKLMLIVLESKVYIAEHYDDIVAACDKKSDQYDDHIASLVEYKLGSNYRDIGNSRSWRDLVSDSSTSLGTTYNKYFGETDSAAAKYNTLVTNHWFDYIQKCEFANGDVLVDFFALAQNLNTYYLKDHISWKLEKAQCINTANAVKKDIVGNLNTGFSKADAQKLLEHLMNNENGVFVDGSESGKTTTNKSLLDILRDFGFEVSDEKGTALFVCDSKGYYSDNVLDDRHLYAELFVDGYDCGMKNGYTTATGEAYTPLPQYETTEYYNYHYENGVTTRNPEQEYSFYFFRARDPEIRDEYDFMSFIRSVAGGRSYYQNTVNLMNDLDLSDIAYNALWSNMSDSTYKEGFRGTFKGNKHTISGLNDAGDAHGAGLFRSLGDGANISDLYFADVNIHTEQGNAGALAGRIYWTEYYRTIGSYLPRGKITLSNILINSGSVAGKDNVGGIVGYALAQTVTLSGCVNAVAVNAASGSAGGLIGNGDVTTFNLQGSNNSGTVAAAYGHAGGIIGHSESSVNLSNSQNTGNISGKNTGGIIGNNGSYMLTVEHCSNTGIIMASANGGGIVGWSGGSNYIKASGSTNSGSVTAQENAGGIVGQNAKKSDYIPCDFTGCTNSGTVISAKNATAGGIVGSAAQKNDFSGSINSGNISGGNAGGILGICNKGELIADNCTNKGRITASERGGGIIGSFGNRDDDPLCTVKNCTNEGEVKGGTAAGGIAGYINTDNHSLDFSGCKNIKKVEADGDTAAAGGIVGTCYGGGNFTSCTNTAAINSLSDSAGGILGWNQDDPIDFSGSVNSGAVSGNDHTGGIAGYLGNDDKDPQYTGIGCINKGTLLGNGNVGGIIGFLCTDSKKINFSTSENHGQVKSTGGGCAGGIIGLNYGNACDLTYCQNYGKIITSGSREQLVGKNENKDSCDYSGCTYGGSLSSGSFFSEGNLWIILAAVAVIVAGIAVTLVLVKKKKSASASKAKANK